MKKLLVILLILMLTIIPSVSAADENVALTEGVTSKEGTTVELQDGKVVFEASQLKATAYTDIDGVRFTPANTKTIGNELIWETGEKQYFIFDDPTVKMAYQYTGKTLKETITLKEDKVLSFPVTLGADSQLIPWYNGHWKIVSSTSGDTMRGIIIEKPYGIDANGARIEMEYAYTNGNLNLVYNRTITKYSVSEVTIPEYVDVVNGTTITAHTYFISVPSYSQIAYPLVIDPTWTSVGSSWVSTDAVPGYTIVNFSTVGTTTWTVPPGVTSVSYLTVAGGGGGGQNYAGGGGAGGVLTGTLPTTPSTSLSVTVGAGGSGGSTGQQVGFNGQNSTFANTTPSDGINAKGGGGGVAGGGFILAGSGGSGGGGASGIGHTGGSGTLGQGRDGGAGVTGGNLESGGGGGNQSVGADGSGTVCGSGGTGYDASAFGITSYGGYVAGGGGGGAYSANTVGTGGSGVGGSGGASGSPGASGVINTGSGGGGGGGGDNFGGDGGSGVVFLKYLTTVTASFASANISLATNTTARGWEGYTPFTMQFVNTSTGAPHTSWVWNYTAIGSTIPVTFNQTGYYNPIYTFTNSGNYSIKLNVNGSLGTNISTQTTWVNITNLPSAVTPVWYGTPTTLSTYGMNVQFTNGTTIPPVTNVLWDFNDTYTSTSFNPSHWYSVAGKYTVSARWTNATNTWWDNKTNYINLTSDLPNVKSWLHMDGAAGGTTFNGEIGSAWTPTSVTTETSQKKFGTASALFNANGDRLQTPSSIGFDFGTGDFTIEFQIYPTAYSTKSMIISRTTNGDTKTNGWGIFNETGGFRAWFGTTGNQTGLFNIPLNTWSHVAVQRLSGNVLVYVNGIAVTSSLNAPGNYDTANAVVCGDPIGGGGGVDAARMYLDETRISNANRWTGTFSPPYAAYAGDLEPAAIDSNPGSTLRFKTNPSVPSNAVMLNQTPRYRTVQIQNVNITNNISTVVVFNPDHVFASGVTANSTTFSGINFTSIAIDNAVGTVTINATRPTGFSTNGLTDNRASFADIRMVYWNYSAPCVDCDSSIQFFGSGYLYNLTNTTWFPVHNFIATNVSYLDWDTFPSFTSNKTTEFAGQPIQFTSTSTGFPNIYNWSWGDGTWTNGTDSAPIHTFNIVGGSIPVTLYGKLWQNMSVSNSTTNSITLVNPVSSDFVQSSAWVTDSASRTFVNSGNSIWYNSTSLNATWWTWNFYEGDGTPIPAATVSGGTPLISNLSFAWTTYGNKTVELVASMAANTSISNTNTKLNFTTVEAITADFTASATTGIPGAFIIFTDHSILTNTTGVYYNWSFGDGSYSDSTGATIGHIYSASGIYTVTLIVGNYGGYDTMTKPDYIIISSNSQQSTWYSPLQVDYQIVNKYGEPLPGMRVDCRFYEDTFPDKPWLTTVYGMPDTVKIQMEDSNLLMSGLTSSDGSIVFTQHSSLQYKVNISGLGYKPMNLTIQPADNKYTIWMDSPVINNSVTQVNATLTFSQPDIYNATFGVRYQDTSGYTTALEFVIKSRVNGTEVYRTSIVPGTGQVWINKTIPNVRGEAWRWYYNAVRLV